MATATLDMSVLSSHVGSQLEAYALQEKCPLFFEKDTNYIDEATLVGSGGFGDVYALGRTHVLKVYKQQTRDVVKQAKRELKMTTYRHRNVIACFGLLCFDDGRQALIFERGGDELYQVLVRIDGTLHDLYFELYKLYLHDLFSGLAFLRASDIVHGDLKPENLLVTPTRLQIADFGFAHSPQWSSLTKNRTVCGSFGYVPDDALALDPTFFYRRDPWAAACIVFALTYGGMMYEHSATLEYDSLIKKLDSGDTVTPFASMYPSLSARSVGEELMTHLMFETKPSFELLCEKLRFVQLPPSGY